MSEIPLIKKHVNDVFYLTSLSWYMREGVISEVPLIHKLIVDVFVGSDY
jgi:hypothetical protein